MIDQFASLCCVLDNADAPIVFFFRDDDAGWADKSLLELCDRFRDKSPLDLAVIPKAVSEQFAGELTDCYPDLGFHQHGFEHVNHQQSGRKGEFGDERSFEAIRDDVVNGREILLAAFGDRLDPIFTPPWNRCTSAAAEAIAGTDITVLSRDRGAKPIETFGLTEVPVAVDWVRYRDSLDDRIAEAAQSAWPVGVMVHHEVLDGRDLEMVDALLDMLGEHPNATTVSMMSLVGEPAAS